MQVSEELANAIHVLRSSIGCRVRRNPDDWEWGDQDGGEGKLGTIIEVTPDGWAGVQWDAGNKDGYRWGAEGKWDLVVVEGPQQPEGDGGEAAAAAAAEDRPPPGGAAAAAAAPSPGAAAAAAAPAGGAKQGTNGSNGAQVLRLGVAVARGDGLGPSVAELLARPFESVWDEYPGLRALGVQDRIASDWASPPELLRDTLAQLRDRGAFRPDAQATAPAPAAPQGAAAAGGGRAGMQCLGSCQPPPRPRAIFFADSLRCCHSEVKWESAAAAAEEAQSEARLQAAAAAAAEACATPSPGGAAPAGSAANDAVALLHELQRQCNSRRHWEMAEGGTSSSGADPFHMAADTLLTFARNVINSPNDMRFRRVNQRNRAYHARLGVHAASRPLMQLLGFKDTCELNDDGDEIVLWELPKGSAPAPRVVAVLESAVQEAERAAAARQQARRQAAAAAGAAPAAAGP